MKREDLKPIATAILQKKFKTFQMAFAVLLGIVIVMFIVSFFSWQKRGLDATVIMPVFFIPMVLINYLKVRKIKKELDSRNKAEIK